MEKVRKYSDFIAEELWKSGVKRAKDDIDRLESPNFFKRPEVHQIKDYPEYYLEFVDSSKHSWGATDAIVIYHKPKEDVIAEYVNYDPQVEDEPEFDPYMEYWEDYYLDGTDEENKLIHSDEFQKAIWETVVEEFYS